MIYLDLFLGFLKVGCFSFGGAYAAIPLIRDVILSHGWMGDDMLSYMIAVSESTPGPIMVNLATYVGTAQAGFWGAFFATFAVVLPSFVVIMLVTKVMDRFAKNRNVKLALRGIKPCMIGIILATGAWMVFKNLFTPAFTGLDVRTVVLTAVLAAVYFAGGRKLKNGVSPIALILISALLGIIVYA